MDKKLPDKTAEEKQSAVEPTNAAQVSADKKSANDFASTDVGAYSTQHSLPQPELTEENWKKSKEQWNSTAQGRLAIRLFSRGVMGAAFFTAGGILNTKWLKGYDHEKAFLEQGNPLAKIAKIIDSYVGRPIELTVRAISKDPDLAKRAITFRPTAHHANAMATGRSLGHEVVNVTFDFFCASIGDAFGRDIAAWVDPNAKKKWMKDGHIDYPEALKSALKSTWRYVSYNGGEDWAVAIPYVYYMKGQRELVNHFSPGFKYDFDRNLNGGSSIVSGANHIGNHTKAGTFDLQHRFVVYNMGTLAYRELYDYIGNKIEGKPAVLWGAPDRDTRHESIGEKAVNVAKWLTRSVIKGFIYMTPATTMFWITRTPQTKYRGLIIDNDQGFLAYQTGVDKKNNQPTFAPLTAEYRENPAHWSSGKMGEGQLIAPKNISWGKLDAVTKKLVYTQAHSHPFGSQGFDPHGKSFGAYDGMYSQIGRANDAVRHKGLEVADSLNKNPGFVRSKLKKSFDMPNFRGFSNTYINAAISYTPYMYAKAETARLWDHGEMDMATERMIDGAFGLKWGEFKAGATEVWRSILNQPMPTEEREVESQRRIKIDTSLPASMNLTDENNENGWKRDLPSWRERLVQGEKPEIGANNPKGHAEREEMREALKHMQPPTNSIN